MMSWVLVLWISGGGSALSTASGFASEENCKEAGEIWKATKIDGRQTGFVCLPRLPDLLLDLQKPQQK